MPLANIFVQCVADAVVVQMYWVVRVGMMIQKVSLPRGSLENHATVIKIKLLVSVKP